MQAQADVTANPFAAAEHAFEQLSYRLADDETRHMTHAEIETIVEHEGREVLRQLLQAHFDVRAEHQVVHPAIVGADGVQRGQHRDSSRQLESLFGTVGVERISYAAPGHTSLRPLDAELNLPPTLYSDGVERRVAEGVARMAYDEVVENVKTTTGAAVAKRQVEEIAVRAAMDFDAFYAQRPAEKPARGALLVLSFDGKGVVMRKEHLREATQKAQAHRSRKLSKRLSKGEKKNQRRMATVAAIYEIAPYVRTPGQIVHEMQPVHEVPPPRPRPQHKRVSASLEKPPEEVVADFFADALQRDPRRRRHWVVLVDGDDTQIGLVQGCAEAAGVDVTIVLDVIHVIEYLWEAALCFHREGTKDAEQWVSKRLYEILRGRASHVAAGMRRSATKRGLRRQQRRGVDKCAGYLLNHREFLKYDEYLAAGYPIATGVIEGACRYLVKDRMGITGARWGLQGAEAVLKLRALKASGDLATYWAFRQGRQYERNHSQHYENQRPPPATTRRASRKSLRLVK